MGVKIFIARHGQNEDNVNGILNGHRDLPLTGLGRRQARDLAEGIREAGLTFGAVYSSPLTRAHETAQIVSQICGFSTPVVLQDLIERDFGVMTGKPVASIEELCAPDIIKTDGIIYFLNPDGAETLPDLIKRGQRILDEVRNLHDSGNVLLVCHGDIGKMVYAVASGRGWESVLTDFHFGNCDLIEVGPNDEAHVIRVDQHNL